MILCIIKHFHFKRTSGSLTIAAADPSDPNIQTILNKLTFKQTELVYCNYELVDQILSKVYEQKNEFLDLLEEIDYEEPQIEQSDEGN